MKPSKEYNICMYAATNSMTWKKDIVRKFKSMLLKFA